MLSVNMQALLINVTFIVVGFVLFWASGTIQQEKDNTRVINKPLQLTGGVLLGLGCTFIPGFLWWFSARLGAGGKAATARK